MRSFTRAAAAIAVLAAGVPASAQAPASPGDGSLVFNPDMRQWAHRAAGVPWFCTADGRCVEIRFDGVAAGQIATAEIAGLGSSGGTYYLALRHGEIAGGRQQAFRCVAEACAPSELPPGDFAYLGTHSLTLQGLLQGRLETRTVILARAADAPERSRLMLCTDRACTDQALTRDNAADLVFLGAAATEGRNRLWLRARSGAVVGCAPSEAAGEDRLDCRPTAMVFPAGDASLVFNPDMRQWAYRDAGVPSFCTAGGRCSPIRFDRVAAGQIAAAEITPLGFAGGTYYLALRRADLAGARQQAFRCVADSCAPAEMPAGDFAFLGTHSLTLQGRLQSRTAILARAADAPERSRLLLCTDRACTEQAFTRDNANDLAFMGAAPMDGRNRLWLRARNGSVIGCAPSETAGEDRLDCSPTAMVFADPVAPATADNTDSDAQSITAAIEDAIRRGNWAEADRLIAEGRSRFPAQPQWAQFERRLVQLRADRDGRARIAQARRLVADARRYAEAGDYRAAEAVLQEAAALAPGLADIAQARAEISRLRAERFQRFRERSQFVAAIEQALDAFRLWEAEGLIGEALRRFPNDADFRNFERRVSQLRAQAEWQGRLNRAARLVASARDAMNRQQFDEAERHLDAAEALAMGLPEIRAARADLRRLSAAADARDAEIRQFTVDIEAALARNQFAQADRMLAFAVRRHPAHPGWADLRRRIDRAKASVPPPTAPIVANARAAIARKDWAGAERFVAQAERLDAANPDVRRARAELTAARDAAGRQALNFINTARTAMTRRDWTTAESAVAAAELADPQNPAVLQVRRDLNAARGSAAGPALTFVNAARAAMAAKDWAAAERAVVRAEAADPSNAAVRQVRADLNAERSKAAAQAMGFINGVRAAFAAKDWATVERAVQQAELADPQNPDVRRARSQLDTARTAAATQANGFIATARAAMARRDWPAADAALASARAADPTNPAVLKLQSDLAAAKGAPPPPNAAPLIAAARAAIAKKDWAEADRQIAQAARLDPKAAADARADLVRARDAAATQANGFIATARAAMTRRDWPAADAALASARAADPTNPAVLKLQSDLAAAKGAPPPPNAAPLIADARAAMAKKDWSAADGLIRRAEGLDPNAPAVKAVRADFTAARNAAATQAQAFINVARAAIARKDWVAADRAAADAERADPQSAAVRQVKADLAAAKGATPPPIPTAPLIADARAAMAKKDWAAADGLIRRAEGLDPNAPAVKAVRADFTAARNAAATQAQAFINVARAAIARKDWVAADRAAADAERADPQSAAVRQVKADLAAAKTAVPPPAPTAPLIANARAAMARKDWPAADGLIRRAEGLDPNAPAVKAVRADFVAARNAAAAQAQAFINVARAAIARKDWVAADRAVADAERADPQSAAVRQVKADLAAAKTAVPPPAPTAPLIANARAAMARKDWPAADGQIRRAEGLDPNAPAVKAVRADFTAARNAAAAQAQPFVNATRAAIASKNQAAAKGNLARAEAIDPFGAEVLRAKAQVKAVWP